MFYLILVVVVVVLSPPPILLLVGEKKEKIITWGREVLKFCTYSRFLEFAVCVMEKVFEM